MLPVKTYLLILLAVYLLCLGIVFGITFLGQNDAALELSTVYEKKIDFWYVFTANSQSMLTGGCGGIISFGIVSAYLFFYNAISLGTIANALVLGGMPDMALRMLPHGLVELMALVLIAVFPVVLDIYVVRQVKPVIFGEVRLGTVLKNALVFIVTNVAAVEGILLVAGIVEFIVSRF